MRLSKLTRVISQAIAIAIVTIGFAPYSSAAVIGSEEFIQAEQRVERIAGVQAVLARQDVAAKLADYGVSAEMVMQRVQNMTSDELLALQGAMDEQVAGGDVLAVIGVVFVVLLVLDLVGVTNVFSAIG